MYVHERANRFWTVAKGINHKISKEIYLVGLLGLAQKNSILFNHKFERFLIRGYLEARHQNLDKP